jgi:hypothetical protein
MLRVGQGLAAESDGRLIGTVVLTRCTANLAAVGSMLVAQDHERRGIGRTLMEAALAAAGGSLVTLIATRHGRPLYERLGFGPVGGLEIAVGEFRRPPGHRPATRPQAPADLPAVAALDARAHGGDRTPLLRAALGWVDTARVLTDGDRVLGWGAAWSLPTQRLIGPLVAVDATAALTLLTDLAAACPGPGRVDLTWLDAPAPGADLAPAVRAWLTEQELEVVYRAVRMLRGGAELPGRPELIVSPIMQPWS